MQNPTESAAASPRLRLANMLASVTLVVAGCAFFRFLPVHASAINRSFGMGAFTFDGQQFLVVAAMIYILGLMTYYASEPEPAVSKSLRFVKFIAQALSAPMLTAQTPLSAEQRLAILTSLLKMFFAPLMAMSLMMFTNAAVNNGLALADPETWAYGARTVFNQYGFWFLMQLIIFVDVAVFTVGYLVESSRLGNTIRSVDPTWLGWAAAIMCYPPFNSVTGALLGSHVSDFPKFDDPTAHVVLNAMLLALMAAYTWASIAMGWKASNLTYRGMVEHGPYAWVRHPAYTFKNLAWWIGSIPSVSLAFSHSAWSGLAAVGSVIGWSALYVLRALTEEDHLRRLGGEYAAYASKVRYRFIRGLV